MLMALSQGWRAVAHAVEERAPCPRSQCVGGLRHGQGERYEPLTQQMPGHTQTSQKMHSSTLVTSAAIAPEHVA